MSLRIFWLMFIGLCLKQLHVQGKDCGTPFVPNNARITLSSRNATYSCDEGYELFGTSTVKCSDGGDWLGTIPFCAVDVAYRKPSNQSTTTRGGDASNGNDGNLSKLHDGKDCTETRKEPSPWWRVDLLRTYHVNVIRVHTPSCCGQHPLQDFEIRVGNSTSISRNPLCTWNPGAIDAGVTQDFPCARPVIGRYVFIQMVGVEAPLSVCEVQVFTTEEISRERCRMSSSGDNVVRTFEGHCYEFQLAKGGDFQGADKYCKGHGGELANGINNVTKNFISGELAKSRSSMSTQLVWIGATKEPGLTNKIWHWVDGSVVDRPMWGPDQPNNYNGEQNCVVLDGGRGWLWNDVGCNLNYLPWICQYYPPTCGSPDQNINTTVDTSNYTIGNTINYQCPEGSIIIGNSSRTCQSDSTWSGVPPTCKHIECGPPPTIAHGSIKLLENRTTYNASVMYNCETNHTIMGESQRICTDDGKWSGTEPSCHFNQCPEPPKPVNATLQLSGRTVNSTARYTCRVGDVLVGDPVLTCQLGGTWVGQTPTCKHIDCGVPKIIPNGKRILPKNSTTYGSEVLYTCNNNMYELYGPSRRVCTESGVWSHDEPSCKMVDCGSPDVQPGAFVIADNFTVGAMAEYFCEAGYVMEGDNRRFCEQEGHWSGDPPRCKLIDCGHVQPILHGQVDYVNSTTYMGSFVEYACIAGYKVNSDHTRKCERSGKWSGTTPSCDEIRCPEPQRPPSAILSVSGNDRLGDGDSFKVGSSVQFRCEKGYKAQGGSEQVCEGDGTWSGAQPVCQYVDCHYPEPLAAGEVVLLSNSTYLGSLAEYRCNARYELVGRAQRACLDNGTWEGVSPHCQEITCGAPDKPPSVLSVDAENLTVGSVAVYHCNLGQRIEGPATRTCQRNGRWSGVAPNCLWVDCGRPVTPQNGEIFLLNQTTTYQSLLEYHCFVGYKLVGPGKRWCNQDGHWSGANATCELDTSSNDVWRDNSKPITTSVDEENEEDLIMSKTIGIAIGVGAGGILLLTIIIALVYMKLRRPKPSMNGSGSAPHGVDNAAFPPSQPYTNMETELSDTSIAGSSSVMSASTSSPTRVAPVISRPVLAAAPPRRPTVPAPAPPTFTNGRSVGVTSFSPPHSREA